MKTLFLIFMLTMITACGGGAGGSAKVAPSAGTETIPEVVYTYEIRIEGAEGASIASSLILNMGKDNQDNQTVIVTVDNSELMAATFFGNNIFWEVYNSGNSDVTVRILKDGVEVKSEVITSTQTKTLRDNL